MKGFFSGAWVLAVSLALTACGDNGSQFEPLPDSAPDGLSYPDPNMFIQGEAINPLVPTIQKGTPTSYWVIPDLPAGLRLTADGRITGTPTEPKSPATYLVTAGNSTGTTSFGVRITVLGRFTIGGVLSGLNGGTLVLNDNGNDPLTLTANGPFTFAKGLPAGSSYSVTVTTQPAGQTCSVSAGSGALTNDNYGGVSVTCSANTSKTTALAGSLNEVAANMARHSGKLQVACSDTASAGSDRGYVIDRKSGSITLLGELGFEVDANSPLPTSCGLDSLTLDEDRQLVSVMNSKTRTVSAYFIDR